MLGIPAPSKGNTPTGVGKTDTTNCMTKAD